MSYDTMHRFGHLVTKILSHIDWWIFTVSLLQDKVELIVQTLIICCISPINSLASLLEFSATNSMISLQMSLSRGTILSCRGVQSTNTTCKQRSKQSIMTAYIHSIITFLQSDNTMNKTETFHYMIACAYKLSEHQSIQNVAFSYRDT